MRGWRGGVVASSFVCLFSCFVKLEMNESSDVVVDDGWFDCAAAGLFIALLLLLTAYLSSS